MSDLAGRSEPGDLSGRGDLVLALDLGGTKTAAALVDPDGGLHRVRRAPTGDRPEQVLRRVVDEVVGDVAVLGVGIGCGGPLRRSDGWVAPLNTPVWQDGFAIGAALRARFPGVPVRLHNDVVALVVGEHWRGAGRGVDDLLGAVVSTGVGGGVLVGGRVLEGRTGNAGHVGHVVVEPAGPACGCGGRGCVEAVARGPAVVAWARARGCTATDGRELAALAAAGDETALAALARAGWALALGIVSAAAVLDVGLVLLGGGLSQAGEPLWGPLRATLAEHARLEFLRDLRVEPTGLGQDSGLVGAGALVHAGDTYWTPPARAG